MLKRKPLIPPSIVNSRSLDSVAEQTSHPTQRLKLLQDKLAQKEKDIALAAEIGQNLLQEIEHLSEKISLLQQTTHDQSFSGDDLEHLDPSSAQLLQQTIQQLQLIEKEVEDLNTMKLDIYSANQIQAKPHYPSKPFHPAVIGFNSRSTSISSSTPASIPPHIKTEFSSDIALAAEIGHSLLVKTRLLQRKLEQTEREKVALREELSMKESQYRELSEVQAKLQEALWENELSNQKLNSENESLKKSNSKLKATLSKQELRLQQNNEMLESYKMKEEGLLKTLSESKIQQSAASTEILKHINSLRKENQELQEKIDFLQNPMSARSDSFVNFTSNFQKALSEEGEGTLKNRRNSLEVLSFQQESFAFLPPAPEHVVTFSSEALMVSLNAARDEIITLSESVAFEKKENLELRSLLKQNEDIITELRSDITKSNKTDAEVQAVFMPEKVPLPVSREEIQSGNTHKGCVKIPMLKVDNVDDEKLVEYEWVPMEYLRTAIAKHQAATKNQLSLSRVGSLHIQNKEPNSVVVIPESLMLDGNGIGVLEKPLKASIETATGNESFSSDKDFKYVSIPYSPDPIILALSQTMIGNWFFKFTRYHRRPHKRFFWLHPYTKMIYWSTKEPIALGAIESIQEQTVVDYIPKESSDEESLHSKNSASTRPVNVRGAFIANVDESPIVESEYKGKGMIRTALVITSVGRTFRLVASNQEQHELWLKALKFVVRRPSQKLPPRNDVGGVIRWPLLESSLEFCNLPKTSPAVG